MCEPIGTYKSNNIRLNFMCAFLSPLGIVNGICERVIFILNTSILYTHKVDDHLGVVFHFE